MSWIPHHHTHTHIHVHASTLADTHPINCSAFTVLPHVFFARSLQASWEAPGARRGPWSCPNTPNEGLGKFLALLSLPVYVRGTSATQCADLGVRLAGSRCGCSAVAHSHATTAYPLPPHYPELPDTRPQLHNWLPFTSSISQGHQQSTSDDAHLCVWAGRYAARLLWILPPAHTHEWETVPRTAHTHTNKQNAESKNLQKIQMIHFRDCARD